MSDSSEDITVKPWHILTNTITAGNIKVGDWGLEAGCITFPNNDRLITAEWLAEHDKVIVERERNRGFGPSELTDSYKESTGIVCPACGLPAEVPGEGRYCGNCQDHEGTCRNDHCMTCGEPT